LANENILKYESVLKLNIHEVHMFLAHKIDKGKLREELMKPMQGDKVISL